MAAAFDEFLPRAIAIGMTTGQYWDEDCMLVAAMREADRIRADRENRVAWLHGLYAYKAIGAMAPMLNAFSKSRRAREYPEPVVLDPHQEAERRRAKGIEYMRAMMAGRARTLRERARADG